MLVLLHFLRNKLNYTNLFIIVIIIIIRSFDVIDHSILLNRLQYSFDVSGTALAWLHTYMYLSCRQYAVLAGSSSSAFTDCTTSVPQGSVLAVPFCFHVIPPLSAVLPRHIRCTYNNTQMIPRFSWPWLHMVLTPSSMSLPRAYLLCTHGSRGVALQSTAINRAAPVCLAASTTPYSVLWLNAVMWTRSWDQQNLFTVATSL